MEVISIDGTEYVRAAQLARKYKYTSDYIGQLCRSGKVAAKLVGRTWYVSPESLADHQNNRYQKVSSNEKTLKNSVVQKSSRVNVEAVPRGDTAKSIRALERNQPQYLRRIEWKPVKYEVDNSELLPPLRPESKEVRIAVGLAESAPLHVASDQSSATLVAEALPEVALKGTLQVASIDDDFTATVNDENIQENIAISSIDKDSDEIVTIHPTSKDRKARIALRQGEPDGTVRAERNVDVPAEDRYTYDVPVTVEQSVRFAPQRLHTHRSLVVSGPTTLEEEVSSPSLVPYAVLGVMFLLGVSALTFFEAQLSATAVSSVTNFVISYPW